MKFSQIELEQAIQSIPYIQNLSALHFSQEQVSFGITFDFEELDKPIDFNIIIDQAYPLKINYSRIFTQLNNGLLHMLLTKKKMSIMSI